MAVPQYISGRTSYLRVRLAFHPYPQVLPQFCNTGGCEPRRRVTVASLCSWIAHTVSGRIDATIAPRWDSVALWVPRFSAGYPGDADALAGSFYKRHAIRPELRHGAVPSGCWCVRGFRVCFIPLAGCFSPFPHGTGPLAVAEGVEPWRVVPPASHKLTGVRGTQDAAPVHPSPCAYGTLTRCGAASQPLRLGSVDRHVRSYNPSCVRKHTRFGLLPFRSPLLWESRLMSSRAATEMFQFTACPSGGYVFPTRCLGITPGGLPHSESRGSSLVCSSPRTFRRSPRPSSAFSAWASPSYSLSLVVQRGVLTAHLRRVHKPPRSLIGNDLICPRQN